MARCPSSFEVLPVWRANLPKPEKLDRLGRALDALGGCARWVGEAKGIEPVSGRLWALSPLDESVLDGAASKPCGLGEIDPEPIATALVATGHLG